MKALDASPGGPATVRLGIRRPAIRLPRRSRRTIADLRCMSGALFLFGALSIASSAAADVQFFTDVAVWDAAVAAQSFDITASNLEQTRELTSPPGPDAQLGARLTFGVAETGLCGTFTVETLEAGAGLTFDDDEAPAGWDSALSVGDVADYTNDDVRLTFPAEAIHAFGFFLRNNTQDAGESFRAYGRGGLLGTLPGSAIPDSSGHGLSFVGVLADEPLHSVRFDEDAGPDDVAILDFRFSCARADSDGDGLSNLAEARAGTDPNTTDTDGDGLSDGAEAVGGPFVEDPARSQITSSASGIRSLYVADLDGDGDGDLLSASKDDATVAWYPNTDGTGLFGAQQVITSLADGASSVITADIDGDGDADVLSASQSDDKIAWYENTDGAGNFGPQQVISGGAFASFSVQVADLDGDGDIDVIATSFSLDQVLWYENTDGLGLFGAGSVITDAADGAYSSFPADIDGDGDIDVLSASMFDDEIAWYENTDGQGTFGPQQLISTTADGARTVTATDFDGDGDVDVLSASVADDAIMTYENTNGLGTAWTAVQVSASATDGAFWVAAADLDGDGDSDAVSAAFVGGVVVRHVNTTGTGLYEQSLPVIQGLSQPQTAIVGPGRAGSGRGRRGRSGAGAGADTDDDGLSDGDEVNSFGGGGSPAIPTGARGGSAPAPSERALGTDPYQGDTDGDRGRSSGRPRIRRRLQRDTRWTGRPRRRRARFGRRDVRRQQSSQSGYRPGRAQRWARVPYTWDEPDLEGYGRRWTDRPRRDLAWNGPARSRHRRRWADGRC